MNSSLDLRYRYAVGLIWLFTISGIIGFSSAAFDWFVAMTPLNLMIYLAVILFNVHEVNRKLLFALFIPFSIGMIAEIIGVNTGMVFGEYTYGANLGWKVMGVPWMIGVNWAVLTYCAASLSTRISKGFIPRVILASLIMIGLDLLMEVSAPVFDYWEFEGGTAPIQNYLAWLFVAIACQFLFLKNYTIKDTLAPVHVIAAIAIFFGAFLIL